MENRTLKKSNPSTRQQLLEKLRKASGKIAPVWSLENFVAVNPYLGLTDNNFDKVARELGAIGGIQLTMPTSFYRKKLIDGEIARDDLAAAFLRRRHREEDLNEFILDVISEPNDEEKAATVESFIDVASSFSGKDFNRLMINRVSAWAASYFDKGQAFWAAANKNTGAFTAWKAEAEIDRGPEIAGLKGFRKAVKELPEDHLEAAQDSLEILNIPGDKQEIYLHRLLLKVGGWSAYSAQLDWEHRLYGNEEGKLIEFLAILMCWEACIYRCMASQELEKEWNYAKDNLSLEELGGNNLERNLILQEALDLASQRDIIGKFKKAEDRVIESAKRVKAQAVFCIDVRSEVFRRNLELVDAEFETIGFAGFFAFPINFIPLAHQKGEAQCPVLIPAGPGIQEEIRDKETTIKANRSRVLQNQVKQVWKNFRSGAVSCFSFVSPVGLFYLPKLFTDSYGITRPVPHPDHAGLKKKYRKDKRISLEPSTEAAGIPPEKRVEMAKNALTAMSLTENFADFVLIVGHGSTTVNNPHASGLDCGACGGRTGEANAKVAAAVLNDAIVREKLKKHDIFIPGNTIFLACLHDTTTDEVSIYNEYDVPLSGQQDLKDLQRSLAKAGFASRTERAARMMIKDDADRKIKARSRDWSQLRPEWGLAGCSAFVVAPRERTKGLDLDGKSFLHSYQWKKDKDFSILELIMTAPMVVTSWINLQYYASTVDNRNYGSGNKTLHNVTAGLGVLEGYAGDLRVGLPIQSLHDGEQYQHEPVKLSVIIEAPLEAMNNILKRHKAVQELFDNRWIYLLAMNEQGKISHRYKNDLEWEAIS